MYKINNFLSDIKIYDYEKRIRNLKRLKAIVVENEKNILKAINRDLNRYNYETLLSEIYPFYKEINYFIKNLKNLMKPEKVSGDISTFGSKNYIEKRPYGNVLIIAPWNYPFLLGLLPSVGAIASGNKVIVKLSEFSLNTSKLLEDIFSGLDDFIIFVNGDKNFTKHILELDINYVLFTGSTHIGKYIMKYCSKNLIPNTLELGGKCPCIIENDTNINMAVKRIIWGKLLNSGQTCIAPDYILVKSDIKRKFVIALISEAKKVIRYRKKFSNIISDVHYKRLQNLLCDDSIRILYKHNVSKKQTIGLNIVLAKKDSLVMKEEIFGPILPILFFNNDFEAVKLIKDIYKNPLAVYLFTNEKLKVKYYSDNILSGGMCVNDVIMHINNNKLPFGGVGQSGIGMYHGKYSFDTFSHKRAVLVNKNNTNFDFRYFINDMLVSKLKSILIK